jgi:Zn-dependent M28 family amino/carboxypeptidase
MSSLNPAPSQWIGTLDVKYNLGPLQSGWKVKLNISTSNQMRTIYNTIGILRGSIEPDRYVLMGNHRDSWIYGGMDAASGTSSMLEVARVFGQLKTQNSILIKSF